MLRSLKERGFTEASLLAIGDGALGLWAALDEIFPTTRHQRCWNHRKLNVLDKLPKRLHPEVRTKLRALAEAPTRQEWERRRDGLCAWLRARGQEPAAACLERDWDDFVTYYDFPEEHWVHLRTSNPIESIFSGVRLRTNASKRLRVPESALYLVFKLVLRLSLNRRGINAPNQLRCCCWQVTSSGMVNWSWRMSAAPPLVRRSEHKNPSIDRSSKGGAAAS